MIEGAILFIKQWWKFIVGAIVLAPSIFLLGQCRGEGIGRAQMQHALDVANLDALQHKQHADDLAATQRITDTIAVNHQEQELRNAIQSTPDSAPDAVRIQLGCQQLRGAGRAETSLPAVCRPRH